MARTREVPHVIGKDLSLLAFVVRKNPKMPPVQVVRRFRRALGRGSVRSAGRVLGLRGNGRQTLVTEGVTAHIGTSYVISVWRHSRGHLFAIAKPIEFGYLGPFVRDPQLLTALLNGFLEDQIADAVAEAMDARYIDHHACWQLRDELTESVDEMVRNSDYNDIRKAADQALESLLQTTGLEWRIGSSPK